MGCSNTFGNVMVVCDCSSTPDTPNSYNEDSFWTSPSYVFAIDQQGLASDLAAANFTSFMLYMKDKQRIHSLLLDKSN